MSRDKHARYIAQAEIAERAASSARIGEERRAFEAIAEQWRRFAAEVRPRDADEDEAPSDPLTPRT